MRYKCFWEFFRQLLLHLTGVSIAFSKEVFNKKKTCSSIERTLVGKNGIKQLLTSTALHSNPCLTI
jgi:hypothetical protein